MYENILPMAMAVPKSVNISIQRCCQVLYKAHNLPQNLIFNFQIYKLPEMIQVCKYGKSYYFNTLNEINFFHPGPGL